MTEVLSKADLLAAMQRGQDEMNQLIDSLSPEQLTAKGAYADSDWTMKDTLAHLAAWEQRTVGRLPGHDQIGDPITMELGEDWDHYMNRLNDNYYQEFKGIALNHAIDDFRAAYDEIRTAVQQLSEDELHDPQTFEVIVSNTFGHYREHLDVIEPWLARSK